jgi:hypothetical protein
MSTICQPENNNSFAVEDWNAAGICSTDVFTSAVSIQRAPKRLVTFAWSLVSSIAKAERPAPAQEYREAIDSLFEHPMTRKEAAYFRREKASTFVPLGSAQTRLLPPREK